MLLLYEDSRFLLRTCFSASCLRPKGAFPKHQVEGKRNRSFHASLLSYRPRSSAQVSQASLEGNERDPPSLVTDFEKKEFRTPGGADPSKGEQFKYTVYLVADGNTFHEVVQADAKRNNWSIDQVNLTKQVGNYADPHNRFMVICKTDALSSGRGDEQDKSAIFVHIAGSNFLKGQARTGKQPFWMGAGMGYYLEHLVFKKCRVLYLDFDKYYASEDGKAETVKGGTLGPQDAWPPVIRKLCKKDKRVSLQGVMETKITMLTPNESGYIFALTHFMVSNEERLVKYQAFVAAVRDGEEATKELLLESFGYDDDEEFEKEWYDFLESSKFK